MLTFYFTGGKQNMSEQEKLSQSIQEYNLSVSRFARLCGTTRDTLRYYYENELLIPRTDETNGYHYYSTSQISSFFFISTFRQAGCSIKEIRSLINHSSKESVQQIANAKLFEMQKELITLHNKIASLHLGLWLLEKHDQNTSDSPFIEIMDNISVAKTPIMQNKNARHTGDIAQDLSRHLTASSGQNNLSIFPTGVTMSYEDLRAGNYVYNNVISLSILPSDHMRTQPLPSHIVVSCYHDHHNTSIESTYQKILDFVNANELVPCSDLHIISLFNLYDRNSKHTYFKYLFLCVTHS